VAAGLARERRGRGLRLNYPEATAVTAARALEGRRTGAASWT
jgi:urease subunit gamma